VAPHRSLPRAKPILTARLSLSPVRYSDAADLEAMFHDPRVNRFLPYERRSETGRVFVARALRMNRLREAHRFVARERDSGAFVGSMGLFSVAQHDRSAEVGYALDRHHWGRGYASEGVGALVAWGFETLGLHRIEALCQEPNLASIRILRRIGFRREGRQRDAISAPGGRVDLLQFSLLAPEFRRDRARRPRVPG
jgi:RimJ/RimL family protein N-acetyltransferase